MLHEGGSTVKGTSVCTRSRTYWVVQYIERVATHVVFQEVAQVLRRDVQVSGPLQTGLEPRTIHLVFSDTLCVWGGACRRMDIIHSYSTVDSLH